MAYVPDPTDITQPIGSVKAGTADEEFRALKGYIQGLVLGAVSSGPSARQTALIGHQDASGDPDFLRAGTGLALDLVALDAPLALSYAAGSVAAGDLNYNEAIGADATDVVAGLQPGNLSYITKIFNGAWGKTLAPCQYGKVFDKTAQFLVRWPGINAAVSTTEDFGNALTFFGNAKLSTATQILGLNTVELDGTGDYVTVPFTSVGAGSWELFGSFRTTSLAAGKAIVNAGPGVADFGILIRIETTGLLSLYMSSNGTSYDIANNVPGTTVIAINTTYFYRLVFDALAGTYRVYLSNNGAAEVQQLSVASTARVCAVSAMTLGATMAGGVSFIGFLGFTGFRRFASFTSAQATGPTVAPTFADVKTDFFSIPQMKMYEVTAASTVAGTNPVMTAVNKVYLGEVTTGVASVTGVANYAYKGRYDSGLFAVVVNTPYAKIHNLGIVPKTVKAFVTDATGFTNERPVTPFVVIGGNNMGVYAGPFSSTSMSYTTASFAVSLSSTGSAQTTGWFRYIAERGW